MPSIDDEFDFFIFVIIFVSCDILISLKVNSLMGVFITLVNRSIGLMLHFSMLFDNFVTLSLKKALIAFEVFF